MSTVCETTATMNAIENEQLCKSASDSIRHGTGALSSFPGLLKKIIKTEAWKSRQLRTGEVVELKNLAELITAKPLRGWNEDPKKVEAVIKDEPEVLTLYREAMKGKPGRKPDGNTGCESQPIAKGSGNKAYTLSRLEKQAPELFKAVCEGEMSANAAAIKAGFRKVKTPVEQLLHWWDKASEAERAEFNVLRERRER